MGSMSILVSVDPVDKIGTPDGATSELLMSGENTSIDDIDTDTGSCGVVKDVAGGTFVAMGDTTKTVGSSSLSGESRCVDLGILFDPGNLKLLDFLSRRINRVAARSTYIWRSSNLGQSSRVSLDIVSLEAVHEIGSIDPANEVALLHQGSDMCLLNLNVCGVYSVPVANNVAAFNDVLDIDVLNLKVGCWSWSSSDHRKDNRSQSGKTGGGEETHDEVAEQKTVREAS